jgi:tetratricopeptide (TPR) repeat protein
MNYQKILEKATILRCEGNTKESFKEYRKLLKSEDSNWQIEAYHKMALCLKMDYKLRPAINYYNKGVKLSKKIGNDAKLIDLYRDIAITYEYFNKYKEAGELFKKAINIAKKRKPTKINISRLGITEVKLGVVYLHQKQLKEAEKWFKKGDKHLSKGNEEFWKLTNKYHLAELSYVQKNYKKAILIINPLICQAMNKDWMHRYAQFLILRSVCYKKINEKDKSNHDILLAFYVAENFDSKEVRDALKRKFKEYLNSI